MKTAIVADWLVTFGGAEHVLEELRALYPDAPFYTTVAKPQSLGPMKTADIRTTSLQKIYNVTGNHQILLSMMPRAIEGIDLSGYDVVISSSHAVAKGIVVPPSALHVCYCHTPVRYAWEMEDTYLDDFSIPKLLRKPIKKQLAKLRRWDLTSAQRTDLFIANSTTTQERIKRIFGRDSIVIPPPVEARFFEESKQKAEGSASAHSLLPSPYYLAVGRLVPYKRFDLLIELANETGIKLKIAGHGQDDARLRAMAGPTVEFLGYVSDADLIDLYTNAEALFFPQYEDAGIVLLEAQACGTPVIAYNAGGAKDAAVEGITGTFFNHQTTDSIREAMQRFKAVTWNRADIRTHAERFTQTIFRQAFQKTVDDAYASFNAGSFARI